MSVTRLVLRGVELGPGTVRVAAEAARHARVARVAPGEAVEVLDLAGTVGIGTLARWEGRACAVDVTRLERGRGEPPGPLVLGLGVLHTGAFDWAVEKATELGATAVVPLLCERSQGGEHGRRVERWQRVADSAVAQCGRSRTAEVRPPTLLADFLSSAGGLRFLALAGGEVPPGRRPDAPGLTVLVGPEGGLTDGEIADILDGGFTPLPLGPRTLRAETAAVAALAVAQSLAGWLG
jgi:16S rRNA (uracil1498-N3)-methyltransferase